MHCTGAITAKTLTPNDGTITNAKVAADAGIEATKLIHQHSIRYNQASGSDVASATEVVHIFRSTSTIVSVDVIPDTAPTGGDKEYTVDVKKSTGAGAWASILTGVITVDSGSTDRTVQAGVLSDSDAIDNDALQIVIAASGSTGSQGQGVCVVINTREQPQ